MAFNEIELIQLRAAQLKLHELYMVEILIQGKDEYVDEYIRDIALECDLPKSYENQIRDIANACIDHLFKTLSYN